MTTRTGYHQRAHLDELTTRQREVLALVARGRTNGEIANELGIGFDTVKTHVSEILGKLGVESREEAAAAWRADRNVVSRLRRTASGFFVTGFGKVTAGAAGTVIAVGVAAAVVAANGGDGPPAQDDTPPIGSTTTATATPTSEFANFGPTLTDAQIASDPRYDATATPSPTVLPALSQIDGKPVRSLVPGDPVDFPKDLVLIYNVTRYGGHGGYDIYRSYVDQAGNVRTDSVMPVDGARGGTEPYVQSFANAGIGTFFATVCDGLCGPEEDPTPGSILSLWRSLDGGMTWEVVVTEMPLESGLMGVNNGEVLIQVATRPTTAGGAMKLDYAWYPSGRPQVPPAGFDTGYPFVSDALGVAWRRGGAAAPGMGSYATLFASGQSRVITTPDESRLQWHPSGLLWWPNVYWAGQQSREGSSNYFAITSSETGAVEHAFAVEGNDIRITARLEDGRLLGNAWFKDDVAKDGAFRPVIIDLDTATMHQVRGLPAGIASLDASGAFTFPITAVEGKPRRVKVGSGDCLNVRNQPDTSSPTLGCYVDGVIFLQYGDSGGAWVNVGAPDGQVGWASAEFLE